MLIWVFLAWKTILIFEISILEFTMLQNLVQKKSLNLETKCLIWVFWTGIWKYYCHTWNHHPQIWDCKRLLKFHARIKIYKLGTNNASFECFWTGIWIYQCHIWNMGPRICLTEKFPARIRMLKFGTKNALFGYFWIGIRKRYSLIWNQHPLIFLKVKFRTKGKILKSKTKNTLLRRFGLLFCLIKLFSYFKSASLNLSYYWLLSLVKNKNP